MLRHREIPFELSSTSDKKLTHEAKMPPDLHSDVISEALVRLEPNQHLTVKWDHRKDPKWHSR
jgi:hypothetical protein